MKQLLILLALFLFACSDSGGGSSGRIEHPQFICLDGFEASWWIDIDGSLNFENQTSTTYHTADGYWPNNTFIIQWNCNYDLSIDQDNHLIIRTFEDLGAWELTDTQVATPECTCGG
jgi:hypothetical protein